MTRSEWQWDKSMTELWAAKPVFGGCRGAAPCYMTCAFYRDGKDLTELRDEMEMLVRQGHTGFKVQAGGASLACDLERLVRVSEAIGDEVD